jgi:hypothetical protein
MQVKNKKRTNAYNSDRKNSIYDILENTFAGQYHEKAFSKRSKIAIKLL